MKTLIALCFLIIFTTIGYAQNISPPIEFFMHGRDNDTFLRDHFQFAESKPLRIEYSYTNWLDSGKNSSEYKDNLKIECLFPIYNGEKFKVDIPLQYSYIPVWGEADDVEYGRKISIIKPQLMTRWTITPKLKSIVGWEYNLKGDGEYFGNPKGRKICLLKGFLSYDLYSQLNLAVGARFDRYYYDTYEESDTFKLDDRLYYQPAAMINWHPSKNFIILLGIPYMGAYLNFGNMLKAEARLSIDKEMEFALKTEPIEKTSATLRFFNTPYLEVPAKERVFGNAAAVAERLSYTDKRIMLEIGRRLNPAAEASLAFVYALGNDLELDDKSGNNVITLDGKPHFDIAATFTLELDALTGKR